MFFGVMMFQDLESLQFLVATLTLQAGIVYPRIKFTQRKRELRRRKSFLATSNHLSTAIVEARFILGVFRYMVSIFLQGRLSLVSFFGLKLKMSLLIQKHFPVCHFPPFLRKISPVEYGLTFIYYLCSIWFQALKVLLSPLTHFSLSCSINLHGVYS